MTGAQRLAGADAAGHTDLSCHVEKPLQAHRRRDPLLTQAEVRAFALAVVFTLLAALGTRFGWRMFSRTPYVLLFATCYASCRWGTRASAFFTVFLSAVASIWAIPPDAFRLPAFGVFVVVGVVAVHLMTDRDRAIAALEASEAQFRATWEHAALGAAVLDCDGNVERINPALERTLGYPSVVWTGVPFSTFSHPDDVAAERERFAQLMASVEEYYQREQRYRRQDGSLLWGRVTVSVIRAHDGKPKGALMVLEDVTARRQAESDLRASEEKLRRSQKMEAVGQLVAGVAHNFNNLLTVTTGYAELLLERHGADEHDRSDIGEIRKASERGTVLTRQLMAFSRKQDAAPRRIDLNRVVGELREILTRVIREDIHLDIAVAPEHATVLMDPHDLEQVVLNLVINARDALPNGGAIQIDIGRQTIDAANSPRDVTVAPGEYVRLRVRDDGTGMTPEVQAHLFEPFFTTKDVGQGTGLGLAFVYGIVRQRGFITVDTAPGKGTTFTLYFPLESPAVAMAAVAPTPTSVDHGRPSATILLVEDEDAVRAVTALTLGGAGYRVLQAARPSDACAIFERQGSEIDLLLTDVIMPEMHGPALAERLVGRRPDLRVLFVSGYSDAVPTVTTGTGKVQFLSKPFQPSVLISTVADLLSVSAS